MEMLQSMDFIIIISEYELTHFVIVLFALIVFIIILSKMSLIIILLLSLSQTLAVPNLVLNYIMC